jgi:hypothetical protein
MQKLLTVAKSSSWEDLPAMRRLHQSPSVLFYSDNQLCPI